jgi:hypothetical protein
VQAGGSIVGAGVDGRFWQATHVRGQDFVSAPSHMCLASH